MHEIGNFKTYSDSEIDLVKKSIGEKGVPFTK